ncbi:uncharacterized protein N7483_001831 [Penicillium malachiteum]|uniref:uncharacterized protein n=1 Tax=Penicillium malachiteum TaxID=1324776 RepID=UPI002549A488|nr:uncharacterized protein N7483_001831 [Penicillium malachiteum]KAJ5736706.1 hypothetical protein N7483_001831 [Penicillium malachiteum]
MATVQMTRSARLSDDAATAALLAANPRRKASVRENKEPNHLSGGASTLSAASAGAALAHANRKSVDAWRPGRQVAAEKAALHVKDLTPPESPQPNSQYSAVGLGAAILAVREQRNSTFSPTQEAQQQDHARQLQNKARQAATGAYTTGRRRADSAPSEQVLASGTPYALRAAGASHRLKTDPEEENPLDHLDSAMEASRIRHVANTNAKLYTSSPPIASEIEERNRQNSLRAAAISMAKDMYEVKAPKSNASSSDSAIHAAQRGTDRLQYRKSISATEGPTARRVMTLQEAAQKRAAEKLATMQDDHTELQNYYGTRSQPAKSLLTTRRRRTSSDADVTQVDAEQSKRIRNQMSSLRTKLDQVDEKRTKDRELLMAAAQRNVNATMIGMDMKMYADTGRAPPSLQREWDEAAQERIRREAEAAEASGARGNRINIGKNQYMDMADVEAVARSRLQPTFDEMTENAEQRRAQELEAQLDAEEKERHAALEKEREASLTRVADTQKVPKEKRLSRGMSLLWRTKSKLTRSGRPLAKEPAAVVAADAEGEAAEAAREEGVEEPVVQDQAEPEVAATGAVAALDEQAQESREELREDPTEVTEPVEQPAEQSAEQSAEEPALVTAPEAPEAAAPATVVTAAHIGAPVSITEPTEYAGRPGLPGRSMTTPRDAAAVGAGPVPMHDIHPVTSPRADSKLKTWFRDRLVRRSSGPVRVYPHQPGPEYNRSDSVVGFTGGAALTGRRDSESRSAALSSHPLSQDDLDQGEPSHEGNLNVTNTKTPSDDSAVSFEPEYKATEKSKKRRSGFRQSFLKRMSRTEEPKTNGATHSDVQSSAAPEIKVHGTDFRGLRDSAADQGLPVPPILGETASTGRESRFSEDLS